MSLEVEEEAATERSADLRKRSASPAEWFLVNTQAGTALSLNREMVFVGRLKCDVVLESASIDNRHAVICFNPKDGCVYLRDLNTVHGSFVNEQKLPGASYVKIQPNDKLRFGLSSQIFIVSNGPHIPEEKSRSTIDMPISADTQNPEACDKNIFRTSDVSSEVRLRDAPELAHVLPACPAAAYHQRMRNKMNQSSSSIFQSTPEQHPSCNKTPQTVTCENGSHKENGVIGSAEQDPDPDSKSSIFSAQADAKDAVVPEIASPSKPHPAAFTISFDDDVNDERKKTLAIGDSIRKFAPRKTFERHRRNSKPPSTHSNQSPTEIHEPRSLPIMSDTAPKSGPPAQLSDSAVFLIQRMFESEQSANKDEEDLKSEAGTYTLESDCKNVDLERARKMIDNVFGVEDYVESHAACFIGSIPGSPRSSRSNSCHKVRSNLPKEIQRPQIPSLQDETRSRTFTRSKPRRGSLQEQVLAHSPDSDAVTAFERAYSLRSKVSASPRKPIPNPKIEKERRDSISSSKSGLSSKTIEVKNAAVINHVRRGSGNETTRSPRPQRRQTDRDYFTRSEQFSESVSSGSGSGGPAAECASGTPTGLKLNRAFALRRARLGIETPGVPLNLTDEKQKKNQDNKNRKNIRADTSLSRSDGGRFSLRVSKTSGKPPLPSSHPASPEKRSQDLRKQVQLNSSRSLRAASESNQACLSPSSSSSSIPNQYVQRSSSFGPQSSARSSQRKPECSERSMRAMTPMQMTRRMFSVRPHQQQQYTDSVRNKQQANVAPIKRSPETCAPSQMTTSLNEQISDQPVIQRRHLLSSLDNLVVSAILQLSGKLRFGMREWLDQEKVKHAPGSETRLMIDEILPQVSNMNAGLGESASASENLSKDLSSILKNLKKVEQSLEGE